MQRGLISVCFFSLAASVWAQDWQPTLIPPESGVYQSGSSLRIGLPPEVDQSVLPWLALELDNVDVSQIVSLESAPDGQIVSVTPPQPLGFGDHELRLVQYTERGDIIERGAWTVQIKQTTKFQQASVAATTTLNVGHRVDEDELKELQDETQGQGTAVVFGNVANPGWQIQGRGNFLYDSLGVQLRSASDQTRQTPTLGPEQPAEPQPLDPRSGRDFEVSDYLVSGQTEQLSALIGHHALSQQSLIMQDFHRRGVSMTGTTPNEMFSASGFAFRTEPITGFRDGLGVGKHEHRVAGALASVSPLPGFHDALTVSTMYLTAMGQDQVGVGVGGDDLLSKGDAWALVAESRLAGGKVQMRGEIAETDFDFDGTQSEFESERDDAQALLMQVVPVSDKILAGKPVYVDFGVEYQNIGPLFRSLANASLPADKDLFRAFSNFQWSGLVVQFQGGREKDNVDNVAELSSLRNELTTLAVSYTPKVPVDDKGLPKVSWLGQPSLTATTQSQELSHTSLPPEYAASRIHFRTTYSQLGAAVQYNTWSWYLGHGYGEEKDLTGVTATRRTELTDLSVNWRLGQRVSLGAQHQYSRLLDQGTGTKQRTWASTLNAQAILIPAKLTANLNIGLNENRVSDDSFDTDTKTYGLNLDYQFIQPKGNRPGLGFWLSGERQELEDKRVPSNNTSPYQVFLGVKVIWPLSYPMR